MTINIKRIDTTLPLPAYMSQKAAAFDLYAREDVEIPAQSVGYVPLNSVIQLPPNHWLLLSARSSLHKKGLLLANGIGVGDEDFCGEEDEYKAALLNFTSQTVRVTKGDRIVQGIVLPREQMEIKEVSQVSQHSRGGFGSTGK